MAKALDPLTAAAREGAAARIGEYACLVPSCSTTSFFARPGLCADHLHQLPPELHATLWYEFRFGQERGKVEPTPAYTQALEQALALIAKHAVSGEPS